MHVDGVVTGQSSAQLGSLFDLQRIEILRGPQGTLYGRNTTGGSINVITHQPTEDFTGYGRFTAGSDTLLKFEGAAGGGITDNILGRLAVKIEERDGYGENLFNGDDVDDASRQSVRAQLHWLATRDVDFRLSAEYHREDDSNYMPKFRDASYPNTVLPPLMPQPVGAAHAADPRDIIADTPIQNKRDQWSLTGTLNWQIDDRFKLTSITNYQEFTKDPQQDFDVTGLPRFSQAERIDSSQFSQELQLHYEHHRFSGILGLYYYNEEIKSDNRLISNAALVPGLNNAITLPDEQLSLHFRGAVNAEASAVFANLNFALTDTINIILGGRYSYENRKGFSDRIKTPPPFAPARTFADEGSFNDFTPKAGIEWKAADDLMFYFTYTEGFKSGILLSGQENPLLEPETVESFEIGAKGRFFNDRLQLNLAAFSYDFTNLQVGRSLPSPGGFVLVFENAAAAEIEGVEVETSWLATDQLRFDASLTYIDATYEDFLTRDPFDLALEFFGGPVAVAEQIAGNRLPQAPEWAWMARGEYSFSTQYQGWNGVLGAEVAYKDDIFFTPQNFVGSLGQESEVTLNANLKFTSADGKWYLNLWGKNLTDELIYSGSFIINTTRVNLGSLAPPRTFGATLGYNF
jgi:iron complex outermembrane receptor protein